MEKQTYEIFVHWYTNTSSKDLNFCFFICSLLLVSPFFPCLFPSGGMV